jgi:predicted acylesterase/phospholipase RssA
MHDRGLMRDVHRFAGSSVGAVIAAACALRMDAHEIADIWRSVDYDAMVRQSSGGAMYAFFRDWLARKTGNPDATFREIHRATGTTLVVAASCLSPRRCVYFTHADPEYADVSVALALRMSCSLPNVLEPVRYKGLLFADGGITDALPLAAFAGTRTLGVRLVSHDSDWPSSELDVIAVACGPDDADAKGLMRRGYEEAHRFFSPPGRPFLCHGASYWIY